MPPAAGHGEPVGITQPAHPPPLQCLGPVCVPLHLLLPFLVALAHQVGVCLCVGGGAGGGISFRFSVGELCIQSRQVST